MKEGILTQILVCKVAGSNKDTFAGHAIQLGFTMFSFNGNVYSTSEYLNGKNISLFKLSDLVDYSYNG